MSTYQWEGMAPNSSISNSKQLCSEISCMKKAVKGIRSRLSFVSNWMESVNEQNFSSLLLKYRSVVCRNTFEKGNIAT